MIVVCTECNGSGEAMYYVETVSDENTVTLRQRKGNCRTCNGSGKKLLTNADRIRAMSDEELAMFLCNFRSYNADVYICEGCKAEQHCHAGHTGTIDWLQQPAEEANNV